MKNKINQIGKRTVSLLVLGILLVGLVSAYGVAAPYWKGHPVQISPGDTKTVSITLQNVEDEDITVNVKLKKGSEIASIREGIYDVPAHTINTEILVTVTVPEDAEFGDMYEVIISSTEVVSGGSEGLALGVAIDTAFDVEVLDLPKSEPQKDYSQVILIVIALIVLIAIIFLSLKKKESK